MKKFCSLLVALSLMSALPAFAHEEIFYATLSGAAEALPTGSPGTGFATVTFDLDLLTMRVETTFSGLVGTDTASHIHCCTSIAGTSTAGVATVTPTFTGFPSGVTSGSYDHTFDMTLASSYNSAFISANGGTVTSAFNTLLSGVESGKAYLNIHTTAFPGGEIRGFLAAVPEPSSYAMLFAGLGLIGAMARRRTLATAAN